MTAHSEKIIDHVYASDTSKIAENFVPSIAISDHYPVGFTRTTSQKQIKRQSHTKIQYRCFKKFNDDLFQSDLSRTLCSLQITSDTNVNFSNWIHSFLSVLDRHAPIKSKRVRREWQPEWYNNDITEASRKRDTYHNKKNWSDY